MRKNRPIPERFPSARAGGFWKPMRTAPAWRWSFSPERLIRSALRWRRLAFPSSGMRVTETKPSTGASGRRASAPSYCTPSVWSFRLWTGFSPVSVKEASSLRSRKASCACADSVKGRPARRKGTACRKRTYKNGNMEFKRPSWVHPGGADQPDK